jgi:hypothetical protein
LYCSPNIIQVTVKNEMDRACSTYGGEERWWGNLNETDHLEDLGRDGITILKGIFQEIGLGGGGGHGLDFTDSRQEQVAGTLL